MASLCELCTEEHMCHSYVLVTSSRAPLFLWLTRVQRCPHHCAPAPLPAARSSLSPAGGSLRESQTLLIWGCGHVSWDEQGFHLRAILGVELRAPGQHRAVLSSDLVRTGPSALYLGQRSVFSPFLILPVS